MSFDAALTPRAAPVKVGGRDLLAFAAFFLSGFIALLYEICWIRKGSLVFGAATPALSTVLAVLFAGMALGSYGFGRYAQRRARPLVVYAAIEVALGVFGVASPMLFALSDKAFGAIYPLVSEQSVLLVTMRAMLLAALLLIPATLMGGTLPLFCRHYVVRTDRISKTVGLLYGCNTLGAALGCAVTGFLLIPRIGVNTSLYLAGAANILIGLLVWRLFRGIPSAIPPTTTAMNVATDDQPSSARRFDLGLIGGLFFGTGLTILANEVLWTRFLSLLVRNTVYTYTTTLTVILVGMVIGSVLTSWLFDRTSRRALVFGGVQVLSGLVVLFVLTRSASWWQGVLERADGAGQIRVSLIVLLPAAVLAGISFPLAIRMALHTPRLSGIGVGRMTAINTVGGIVGALAAGFVILPIFGLHTGILLTTGWSLVLGIGTWLVLDRTAPMSIRAVLVLGSLITWLIIARTDTRLPADFLADRDQLIAFREGVGSSLAVVRRDEANTIALEIDRLWQGENRRRHQIIAAHVPALLHAQPRDVLVVGTGIGQTASRFLMHGIERLDCVDIEPEVMPLVREYFESAWMDDPRVRFLIEDGRNYITHTDAMYDLISIEVGQVFRPGVASFYTLDFYREAQQRLRENGLLCQFVPVSFFDLEELRMVLRTFREAFPQCVLWYNTSELLLIGTAGAPIQLSSERLNQIESRQAVHQDLRYAYWGGPAEWLNRREVLLAGFLCGPVGIERLSADAPIYRDDRPHLEYSTSRQRPTSEIEIVAQIRTAFEPVTNIMDEPPPQNFLAEVDALRERNLRDIVAEALKRPVKQLRAQGRASDAIAQLKSAMQWNDQNIELNLLLAHEYISQGNFSAAVEFLSSAIRIDPDNSRAHYGLGHALQQTGQLEQAIEHYALSLVTDPKNAQTHNSLGTALAQLKQFDRAHKHFQKAVDLEPDSAKAHNNFANLLVALGRPDEAVESYRRAVRLSPRSVDAWHNMGIVLLRLERFDEAIEAFRSVLTLRPDHSRARALLIEARDKQK